MVLIVCALRIEADKLIKALNLKERQDPTLDLFENNGILLAISGVGKENIAFCVGYVSAKFTPKYIVNIGICGYGGKDLQIGDMVTPQKIIDEETSKVYHTDYKGCVPQQTFVTHSKPLLHKRNYYFCVDMETSAFWVAANKILSKDKIFSLRIVSDFLDKETITLDLIHKITEKNLVTIVNFLKELL